jgi:hypothetical protein
MIEQPAGLTRSQAYLTEWTRLKERLPELQTQFALTTPSGELITDWMRETSELPILDRVALYRQYRLEDQLKWYSNKANLNATRRSQWFWALFLIEAASILYAALQAWLLPRVSLLGFLGAFSAGIVAWIQIKRHSDLSTSYAVAAEDLALISERFKLAFDQKSVNALVENVEEAVSREHSMWLARRVC